jgi:hypothetical protein
MIKRIFSNNIMIKQYLLIIITNKRYANVLTA